MPEENPPGEVKLSKNLDLKKDFKIPSFDEWKAQVEKDLKGASYEKKLITKTYEGIELQPIYTEQDSENISITNSFPGKENFLRGSSAEGYINKTWDVNQEINIADVDEFNSALHQALQNGQNCINLTLDTATKLGIDADYAETGMVGDYGLSISGIKSLERAIKNINLTNLPLKVNTGFNLLPFLSLINSFCKVNNYSLAKLSGSVTVDPLGHLAFYGTLPVSFDFIFNQIKVGIEWANKNSPDLKIIEINLLPYLNSGASAVQELAFAMSTAVFYINNLLDREMGIDELINKVQFNFGIGTNHFTEIAKFRAARVLWCNITKAYNFDPGKLQITFNAKTSQYFQTNFDPYVNLLRSATETFSAIIGGVESITSSPFDESLRTSDNFSRRIARNTQTILREEAHLNKVIDPAGGSYFIESLTEEIAKNAWELFQEIETKGGMLEALKTNYVQDSISEIVRKREKDINTRKSVIVGINMFADIKEMQLEEKKINQEKFKKQRAEFLQKYRLNGSPEKHEAIIKLLHSISDLNSVDIIDRMSSAFINGATLGEVRSALTSSQNETISIEKLNIKRASEGFEKLRIMSLQYKSQYGSLPKIFLANMGQLKDYKARADFSKDFFEIGGFEVIYPTGFTSIDKAVKSVLASDSNIVVICSTDNKYPELVPGLTQKLKSQNKNIQIILAGYPKDMIEVYKKNGIDDFIFQGADALQILTSLYIKIGGNK